MPSSHACLAGLTLILAAATFAGDASAQQPGWQELNTRAVQLYQQGKYAEAIPVATEAVTATEAALGPDNAWVAAALNNLAQAYVQLGSFADAAPLFQRALAIQEKIAGPEDKTVATFLSNIALLDDNLGKYAEAEPLYQRAILIHQKALGPDDPAVALDLNNLSALYHHEGRLADAESLASQAVRIDQKALGPDDQKIATDLNNLAAIDYDEGKYADAEPLYQGALRIWEKAVGPDHPVVASCINNLAALYVDQGKYAEAEPLYQRALNIREKAVGPGDPEIAIYLNNLAYLKDQEGKEAEAEALYQRAIGIQEKALGPKHRSLATSLTNLAMVYVDEKEYAKAQPLSQRALLINEKALGPNHTEVAKDLNNLAVLECDQARYTEAEPLFKRALSIHEKAFGSDHPDLGFDLNNLALLYDDEGKYLEAEPYFQRLINNLFNQFQYNFSYMTEKERLGFLDTVSYNFPAYFSFVHRYRTKDPGLIGSMYDVLLWEKGFVAGSVADLRRSIESSGDADARGLLSQLTAKRSQIAVLLNTEPADRDLWRQQIDQLRTEANDIEKSLVARSSAFAERSKLNRASWQQIRDALKPGEAAVEFARFDYYDKKWTDTAYYVALVVTHETRDHPQYIVLADGRQLEGEAIARFKESVRTRGLSGEPDAEVPGADAYALIWRPLESALSGKTRIYLSPDGILNQIPLGIIAGLNGKLQMENYDLRLVSSTRDILRSTSPRGAAVALLVGDPRFDLSEEQQRAAIQKLAMPESEPGTVVAALSAGDRSRDLGNGITLAQLPGTGAEVNAIAELMRNSQWKTSVYTNELALKYVVEKAGSPRVVHLATHGFFLPDQHNASRRFEPGGLAFADRRTSGSEDPMLRSGLFFAGADRTLAGKPTSDGLDNGVLTAMEAGNLDLHSTELVVLSACDTGQGDVKNGEGVFGLRRAFQEAGAQEVLMSLWSVPDNETLDLMKRFYTKWLGGVEMHEALKQAQLEIREKVRQEHAGRDLPYYWGAFVIVGR